MFDPDADSGTRASDGFSDVSDSNDSDLGNEPLYRTKLTGDGRVRLKRRRLLDRN